MGKGHHAAATTLPTHQEEISILRVVDGEGLLPGRSECHNTLQHNNSVGSNRYTRRGNKSFCVAVHPIIKIMAGLFRISKVNMMHRATQRCHRGRKTSLKRKPPLGNRPRGGRNTIRNSSNSVRNFP